MSAIFDTHCHYNLEPLFSDWQTHWQKAQAHGVTGALVVGTDLATSRAAVELAAQVPEFKAAIGFHPDTFSTETFDHVTQEINKLKQLFQPELVAAIGEVGLDYYRVPAEQLESARQIQHHAFTEHLKLAHELERPLVIHVRDRGEQAYEDVLQLLRQHHQGQQPFVLHCVSGPLDYVKAALELGAYIGIAGNVTYKNADHLRAIIKTTPPDRLLLETDAPFLPPQPYRGQPCQPWMISQTADFLEEELEINIEQLTETSQKLFA